MNELKIGDRIEVIYVDTNDEVSLKVGMRGTVKSIEKYMIGIEFDDFIGGHYGTWNGQNGHCWYVDSEQIPFAKVIKLSPYRPILGDQRASTRWTIFVKAEMLKEKEWQKE